MGGSSCIHSVIYFWRIKELKRAAKGQIFRVCKCFSSDKRRSDLTAVDRVLKQWFTQTIIFCNQQHFSHAQIKKCKNQRHNCIFAHSHEYNTKFMMWTLLNNKNFKSWSHLKYHSLPMSLSVFNLNFNHPTRGVSFIFRGSFNFQLINYWSFFWLLYHI